MPVAILLKWLPTSPPNAVTFWRDCADVYRHDAYCKEHDLSAQARLAFHQANSGPVMDQLRDWMSQRLDQKQVEPNSGLGKAIRYMLNHWEALTLFLRQPGAPLDNNFCERALKLAILHRKNSMFFQDSTRSPGRRLVHESDPLLPA